MLFGFGYLNEKYFNCSYVQTTGSPYVLKPLPSGVLRPMCFVVILARKKFLKMRKPVSRDIGCVPILHGSLRHNNVAVILL